MEGQDSNVDLAPVGDASDSNTTAEPEQYSAAATDTYDKSQSLVDIANNTFRELCKSLESEQTKLLELEERRKKLQEEMEHLKAEIEEEKQFYQLNLTKSVSDNSKFLNIENDNEGCGMKFYDVNETANSVHLDTCYEEDENCAATARNTADSISIEEQTDHIKSELQSLLAQCITEQSNSIEVSPTLETED